MKAIGSKRDVDVSTPVAVLFGTGVLTAFLWFATMCASAKGTIWFSVSCVAIFTGISAVKCFIHGSNIAGALLTFVLFCFLWMIWQPFFKERVNFTAFLMTCVNNKIALRNKAIFLVTFFSIIPSILVVGVTMIYVLHACVVQWETMDSDRSFWDDLDAENSASADIPDHMKSNFTVVGKDAYAQVYALVLLAAFYLFWASEVICNTIRTIIAGVVGRWFYIPESKGKVVASTAFALTKGSGPICQGSFLI